MLESWTKGSEIVLASNPDYVNFGRPVDNAGAPHMDRLVISTLPEGQTRLAGLQHRQPRRHRAAGRGGGRDQGRPGVQLP
jgi:ABC-type transport system substrate-binding protein